MNIDDPEINSATATTQSAADNTTKVATTAYVDAAVITDHGALTGLGDDDHTQYALVDGTRSFTGNVTATKSSGAISITAVNSGNSNATLSAVVQGTGDPRLLLSTSTTSLLIDLDNSEGDEATFSITGMDAIGEYLVVNRETGKHVYVVDIHAVDISAINVSASGINPDFVVLEDIKNLGTAGGTSVSGVWTIRALNTVVTEKDSTGWFSRSGNRFTLVAGEYKIEARAAAFVTNRHRIRIYNTTDSTTAIFGENAYNNSGNAVSTHAHIGDRINIAGTKTFELHHYVQNGRGTNGFGVETNVSTEIYAHIEITKLG